MQFLLTIAVLRTLELDFGFGKQRREKFLNTLLKRTNELGDELSSNRFTSENSNHLEYDREYNLNVLKRVAEQYGVEFDEAIFEY